MKVHDKSILFVPVFGGDLTGISGQIASPQYPQQYPHNSNYMWTVTVPTGARVRVTFVTMDMESYRRYYRTTCYYDFIKVDSFIVKPDLNPVTLATEPVQ